MKPGRKRSDYIRLGSSNGGTRAQTIAVKGNRAVTTTVRFVPCTSIGTVAAFQNSTIPLDTTVYLEIFARRNFRELPAELNFRVFIFANGDLTIYIVYIANDLY